MDSMKKRVRVDADYYTVIAVEVYREMKLIQTDKGWKRSETEQNTTKNGVLRWVIVGNNRSLGEVRVSVPSEEMPDLMEGDKLRFDGLQATMKVSKDRLYTEYSAFGFEKVADEGRKLGPKDEDEKVA